MTPLLSLQVRRKKFGAVTILSDIAIELGDREIVALLGPSGCGKTTLLHVAAGLDRAFEGHATWRGGTAARIGMVFQQPLLLPWRTVRQNLRLVLPDAGLMPEAEMLLDAVGLADAADALPGTLSLGMARRVAIARALAIRPDAVLLDEPFVSLDPAAAAQTREVVLRAWRARPTAILLVTHDATEALALADRVLMLNRHPGRIASEFIIPSADRRTGDASVAAELSHALAAASPSLNEL